MSSDPPELTRELLSLWQEQLTQKDAQIAKLTSLLQDAIERLADQQRIVEQYLSPKPASSATPINATTVEEPTAEVETAQSVTQPEFEAPQAQEAAVLGEKSDGPGLSGSDLVRMYEPTASPEKEKEEIPERTPIPMSLFGVPMSGMAKAIAAAAGKEAESGDSITEDLEPVRLSQRFLRDNTVSALPVEAQDPAASFDDLPPPDKKRRPILWLAPLAIVALLGVAGAFWWQSAHTESPYAASIQKQKAPETHDAAPFASRSVPSTGGPSANSLPNADALPTSTKPNAAEAPGSAGPLLAHRTPVQPPPSKDDITALNAALVKAAADDDLPRATSLLAQGADVNAQNAQGATALMVAARHGNLSVLDGLLEHGADVNAINSAGWDALMLAARYGQLPVLRSLIKHGARVNDANLKGQTALMLAAMQGHKETASLLLSNGADIATRNKAGQTARDLAALRGHDEVARMLDPSAGSR